MFGYQRKRDDFARATRLSPLGVSPSSPIPASALGTRHAWHPLRATRRRVRPSPSRCQSSHDRASQPEEEESATSTGRHLSGSSSQQSLARAHGRDKASPSSSIPQPTSNQTTTSGLQSLGQQTLGTTGPERKPGPVERAPQVHPHPPERSNGRRRRPGWDCHRGAHRPAERRASLGDEEEEGQGLIEKKVYKRVQRERRAVLPTHVSSIEAQHHASSSRSATRRAGPLRSAIGHVLPDTHCHRPGQQRDRRTLAGTGGRSKGQWRTVHPTG